MSYGYLIYINVCLGHYLHMLDVTNAFSALMVCYSGVVTSHKSIPMTFTAHLQDVSILKEV